MTVDLDLRQALRTALDDVELSPSIPPDVLRRARMQRGVKLVALGVTFVIAVGFVSFSGGRLFSSVSIDPGDRHVVPFTPMEVEAGSAIEGLAGSPLAPDAFPDCTDELVDLRTEIDQDSIDLTVRPKPGVQCGLDWSPEAVWLGADEQRYVPPPSRQPLPQGPLDGRLLLMGDNGASHWAPVAGEACQLEGPIRYFIVLGGEEVEVASMETPGCSARRAKRTQSFWYRMTGVETPAGWLDAELVAPEIVTGTVLTFVLRLTNDTEETIVLGRCPFFDATFSTSSGKTHLRSYLNCPAAPDEIEPGAEVRFPIELPVDNVSGTGQIRFVLRDERRPLQRLTSEKIEVRH